MILNVGIKISIANTIPIMKESIRIHKKEKKERAKKKSLDLIKVRERSKDKLTHELCLWVFIFIDTITICNILLNSVLFNN